MGFKYVFIPASAIEPMQEFEFNEPVSLTDDPWRRKIETYFKCSREQVDKKMLIAQLSARSGKNLEEEIGAENLKALLKRGGSMEIFPILTPTEETGYKCISAYCDDQGVAKDLEINTRATGMVRTCGYGDQQFRGDVFMSAVVDHDDAQNGGDDVWKRVDITLADCSSDAGWLKQCAKIRSKVDMDRVSDLGKLMGMKQPEVVDPRDKPALPHGETAEFKWSQNAEEVEITFKTVNLDRGYKRFLKITFNPLQIAIAFKGVHLMSGTLPKRIDPATSTWTLAEGVLEITMYKATPHTWDNIFEDGKYDFNPDLFQLLNTTHGVTTQQIDSLGQLTYSQETKERKITVDLSLPAHHPYSASLPPPANFSNPFIGQKMNPFGFEGPDGFLRARGINQTSTPGVPSNMDISAVEKYGNGAKGLIPDLFALASIMLAFICLKKFWGSQKAVCRAQEPLICA